MGNWTLTGNQVDIWKILLEGRSCRIQECRQLLSADEAERADRFYFENHRRRFIASRAALRQILAGYLDLAPQALTFCYGPKGKPELSREIETNGIKFNLSHSNEVACLAVAQGLAVGVDVERINSDFATEEIAERFFSVREVQCLQALPSSERVNAFFACWTRKEAYIKALGEGLSVPLDSFEVAFAPGTPAALLQAKVNPNEVTRWSMYDINVAQDYKAALVVEGKGHRLRYLQWESELLP